MIVNRLKILARMCWFTLPKFDAFSFVYKKMKRKRLEEVLKKPPKRGRSPIEMEYTLVDEYLTQREADFYNKLAPQAGTARRQLKEQGSEKPDPKKPLLKSEPKKKCYQKKSKV